MIRGRAALAATLCALALAGAATGGCRRIKNIYSRDQEIQMGRDFARDFAQDPKAPDVIVTGPQHQRLQRVAARILPLAKADWDVPYRVQLLDDPSVNAFAVPGGPIYFNRGLMELAGSDDEVASVLGHEVSHIVRRHSAQQMSDIMVKAGLASILFSRSNDARQIVEIGLSLKDREFSRGDENQADEYGFKYLVAAGYDPGAMASFFRKMQAKAGDSPRALAFLSTHPLTAKRVEAAEKRAAAVRAGTYQAP